MNAKFQNKYRIESARLKNWDYTSNADYFITICTANREHFFGEIVNQKIKYSNAGIIANILWYEIPNHAQHVQLGEFVVMPNHIHGILKLNNPIDGIQNELNGGNDFIETLGMKTLRTETLQIDETLRIDELLRIVETLHATSLQNQNQNQNQSQLQQQPQPTDLLQINAKNEFMASISPKPNSISTIIRSYKSAVTKHANRLELQNGWQTRFHDHIIRDEMEYQRISDYIQNNPKLWKEDKFFTP